MATEVLVFVPGTLGSELWDGNDRVWPGSIFDAITGFSDKKFQRLLKPALVPRDILRSAAGGLVGIYASWIKSFEAIRRGGTQLFTENPTPGTPKTLQVFPYDWRVDLRLTADKLAAFLDRIIGTIPDADIKLVCHSMGGVLSRFYVESGKFEERPAFSKISLLVTFGTPHNGAPVAFAGAVGLHKTEFLSVSQTRQLANDPRYPSLYQLFPVPGHSFIWGSDDGAAINSVDADDPVLVARFGLSASGLTAWKELRTGLTVTRPAHIRYFFVVGTRQETLARFSWDGEVLTKEELDDAGDGTVSLLSAMDPGIQSEFVGKSHVSLIDTRPARETLAALFRGTTVFSAASIKVTLSVRKIVVMTDEDVHVQIEFEPEVALFKGTLRFQRADLPDLPDPTSTPDFIDVAFVPPVPVELNSVSILYINLKCAPITVRGIYRPVLLEYRNATEIIGPHFVVQQEQA